MEQINSLEQLLQLKLRVPAYQRAYAWEKEQLEQFVADMLQAVGKGEYYFGHYILEEALDGYYDIIDGQQRLTTFLLFVLACRQALGVLNLDMLENFLSSFQTVSYDQDELNRLKNGLEFETKHTEGNKTKSAVRMQSALHLFLEKFNSEIKITETENYLKTFMTAQISIHTTKTKAVAVQIFELQNTRGIQLSLIEKVKAKLMKAIYLLDDKATKDNTITKVQNYFAEIYRIEEQVVESAFRGRIALEDLLLVHLQMVDDGTKSTEKDFKQPGSASGAEGEKNILKYLDNKIYNTPNPTAYVLKLSEHFLRTVKWISTEIPEHDKLNGLIGDCFILDATRSLEFFTLLRNRKGYEEKILDSELMRLWEQLLFTRDFHDQYYGLQYRDNFDRLFGEFRNDLNTAEICFILIEYIKSGFRSDWFTLHTTFENHIAINEDKILNSAFHFSRSKITYILYKYELNLFSVQENFEDSIEKLRKVIKEGISVEHIMPIGWDIEWLNAELKSKSDEEREKLERVIHGIGNLIITTRGENSSVSNSHPRDKMYIVCTGGSYSLHNSTRTEWKDSSKWVSRIQERGNKIFQFAKDYFIEELRINNTANQENKAFNT